VRSIRLGSHDKVLGIDFAALDYTMPLRNRFEYKLEASTGLGAADGPPGRHLHEPQSGRYTFRLRGANRDGRWSEGLPYRSTSRRPFGPPLAFAGYGLLLVASVLAFLRVQQRKLERQAEYSQCWSCGAGATRELWERHQQLERVNDELAQASITDSLTGLATAASCPSTSRRSRAAAPALPRLSEGTVSVDLFDLAFVMIDIDNFKMVNDSAVTRPATRCCASSRPAEGGQSHVGHHRALGGDEFVLVARDLSGDGLADLAERIRPRRAAGVRDRRGPRRQGHLLGRLRLLPLLPRAARRPHLGAGHQRGRPRALCGQGQRPQRLGRPAPRPGRSADPGLFGAICHGPQQLVADGMLRVSSSLARPAARLGGASRGWRSGIASSLLSCGRRGPRASSARRRRKGSSIGTS